MPFSSVVIYGTFIYKCADRENPISVQIYSNRIQLADIALQSATTTTTTYDTVSMYYYLNMDILIARQLGESGNQSPEERERESKS